MSGFTKQYFCETDAAGLVLRSMTWQARTPITPAAYAPTQADGTIYEVDIDTLDGSWGDFGADGATYDHTTNTVTTP